MDAGQARIFAAELLAQRTISDWSVHELLGYGKSAIVLSASKGMEKAALKVFHPELMERYGRASQLLRIERERLLIGVEHPNIVKILEAGECDNNKYIFVAMELVTGYCLSKVLEDQSIDKALQIIEDIAKATEFLESKGIVHRDIKPDNIMITSEDGRVVLLDFGVMRPVGDSAATDQIGYQAFVGTHQYAPKEMIHGNVEDTIEGWRAVTFYQIGGVLHDLLVKKPLFEDYSDRIADLVEAIDNKDPIIAENVGPPDCVILARKCLLKDHKERLELTEWRDFHFSERTAENADIATRLRRLYDRRRLAQATGKVSAFDAKEHARFVTAAAVSASNTLRDRVMEVLDDLKSVLPLRTIQNLQKTYPEPTLQCIFEGAREVAFGFDFNFQFSLEIKSENVYEIYVRAGKGEISNELGWTSIGVFLGDLSDSAPEITKWILEILEELAGIGEQYE